MTEQTNQNEEFISSIREKRFTIKDLVGLGILNAVAIVVLSVIKMVMVFTPPIIFIFSDIITTFIVAVIYMLMTAKIPKFGVFTLSGLLVGLLFLLLFGMVFAFVGLVIGGILGDIIAFKWGKFKNKAGLFTAYTIFRFCFALGMLLPIYFLRDLMIEMTLAQGYSSEYLEGMLSLYTIEMFFILLGLHIIGALAGAYIGYRILIKHFVKAGVVKI